MADGFTDFDRALLYRMLASQSEMQGTLQQNQDAVTAAVAALSAKADTIIQQENTLAADLTQLTADVANDTTVNQSAITLIQGLSGMLATAIAALPDPTQLTSLQTQLETNAAALAAAVAAGTPATPPPPGP